MDRLIFINDNFCLCKKELNSFVYLLSEEGLLEKHIPYLEKKISIDDLFQKVKDLSHIKKTKNKIIYFNPFTKEESEITFDFKMITFKTNVEKSFLEKYFYQISNNYLLIKLD